MQKTRYTESNPPEYTAMGIEQIVDFGSAESPSERSMPAAEKVISGQPWQSARNHYSSPCGRFHSGEWQSEPGHWRIHYTEFEYCEILDGVSVIHADDGGQKTVRAGDRFVIPAGFVGSWEVREACRKNYVIFQP